MEVPAVEDKSNYSENTDSNEKTDDQQERTPEYLTNESTSTVIQMLTYDALNSSEKTKTANQASDSYISVDVVSVMPAAQLDQEEQRAIEDDEVGKEGKTATAPFYIITSDERKTLEKIKKVKRAILLCSKSVVSTKSDLIALSTHCDVIVRDKAIDQLINEKLLFKLDDCFVSRSKTTGKLSFELGYIKQVPKSSRLVDKTEVSLPLSKYMIKLDDYLQTCMNIATKSRLLLSKSAVDILGNEPYSNLFTIAVDKWLLREDQRLASSLTDEALIEGLIQNDGENGTTVASVKELTAHRPQRAAAKTALKKRLVCAGINNHFGTGYEAEDVLFVLDTINENDDLKQRFYTATAEEIIESFNANNDIVISMKLVNLIPFTAVCIQAKCNSQPLPTHKLHQIVTLMQRDFSSSCGIYYSTCNECKTRYFPTFYELNGSKIKFITIDSIRKKNAMYFGGKTAYEYLLFLEFDAQLVHNYAAFNGIKQVNTRYCPNHQTPQQRKETSQADRHSNKFIQISNDEKVQVQEMTVISHENLNESSMTNESKLEDIECEIFRSDYETHQKPSYGFLTSFHNCNVIIGFDESARAEGSK
ncbi:unnamed protein product [Didymodactylos carnosus]|uniref:Uncharacterized protein n=1 Tax=Didymodactylos carnosus TaxID=1234261 RepID=A0A8S2I6N3_9BILA|nr:unnamed protein product [Didymodactylos carnosus]CAF3714788.1 unnamed protein product [Didymodactylos carnosus]